MRRFILALAIGFIPLVAAAQNDVPITPAWALGHIVWEDEFNTQEATLRLVNGYLERGIPVNGVIIDSPWSTCYNNFKWDNSLYPEPESLLAELKAKGVHSILWLTGCINTTCNDRAQQKSDNFDEAVAKGYAVNDAEQARWWKGDGIHIDFTNPSAREWWYAQLDGVFTEGVDGFKVDGGETAYGDTVKTSIGRLTNRDFRRYYYDAMFDYAVSRRPGTGMILSRPYSAKSGRGVNAHFANQTKMSLGWCGDFSGDWKGLKEQIADVYHSALAGYGAVGTEIGGFYGLPSTEAQLLRYAQFGAMTACMINGGSNKPFQNHLAWWHSPEAEAAYREVARLHCQLVPYIFSTLVDAHLHGGTLIRDADIEAESHRLGPDFFTKAITSDDPHVRFTLPADGQWEDWKTGKRYPGGTVIERDYGLDEFPLFVRVGAIVPMRTDGGVTLLVCPGANVSEVTIHWPEGEGIAYRDITARYDPATGTATVTSGGEDLPFVLKVHAAQGDTLRFIFMTDIHIESDFLERGKPCYDHYKVGNHASLERTFQFINEDPFCRKASFILLGGDNINTGYAREQESLEAEMVNYRRLVGLLDLYHNRDDLRSFRFKAPRKYICAENIAPTQKPMTFRSPAFKSRVIPIQGNHDTDVPDFYRNCAFQCGGIRFVCFFARYCALPAPPGEYRSTGAISDETYAFVRDQVERAAADPSIKQTILVCHWAIDTDRDKFKNPIVDACEANHWNDNRAKVLALAEKYGIRLYINGHEHNRDYPVGKVGRMYDINCGSMAEGEWSVVEITPDKALFHIYSRATTALGEDGSVVYTSLPKRERTIEVPFD